VVCIAVYLLARRDHGNDAARALTFATMVFGSLSIIMVNRSWTQSLWSMRRSHNAPLRWILLGTLSLLAVVLFVPAIQRLAHFAPLHATDLALAAGAGIASVLWFEGLKRRWRKAA
ncbi:MAG TPA: cation-translocating P-type ATPase C-terminal domain-containing protein, partial [Kofleriaceae bacterium]|nr:cation-translocating P-type ATPase C-terminal domain-containing protein [Kofleriaceae bacterium]